MAAAASHAFASESRCLCRAQGPSLRETKSLLHRNNHLQILQYAVSRLCFHDRWLPPMFASKSLSLLPAGVRAVDGHPLRIQQHSVSADPQA